MISKMETVLAYIIRLPLPDKTSSKTHRGFISERTELTVLYINCRIESLVQLAQQALSPYHFADTAVPQNQVSTRKIAFG
jgi:hypothetical protein